jgi:tetratricopeptide (TPR) repeat protein
VELEAPDTADLEDSLSETALTQSDLRENEMLEPTLTQPAGPVANLTSPVSGPKMPPPHEAPASRPQGHSDHPGRADAIAIARAAIHHLNGEPQRALETLQAVDRENETPDLLMARGYLQVELKHFEAGLETFNTLVALQPQSAEGLFQQGLCFHKLSRIAEALPSFEKAAAVRPDWIEIPLARAICHLNLKQYIAAMEQAEVCLKIETDYSPALSVKAVALHLTWEPERASALYQQVLRANPRCVQTLMNLVTLSLQQKKYEEVRHWSSELVSIQPENALALEGMAVAAFYRGDFENAHRYYEKLTQLMPDQTEHWLNLGTSLQKQSRIEEAAQAYAKACRVRPDSLNAHLYLGAALWKAGDLQAAAQTYETAAMRWPEREELTLSLSQVLEALHQNANAESVCTRFCERTPNRAPMWFRLGYLQWKRGAASEAVPSFERAVELHPGWTEAEINLALALQATGQVDRSESILESVLQREPNHAGALRAMATLALNQPGNAQKALDLHNKLIDLSEANEDVYFNCGVLAQSLNLPEDAIRYYREAIARRKNFAEALLNLGHVLSTIGQTAEAKNYWVPALELKPEFALTYFRRGMEPAGRRA